MDWVTVAALALLFVYTLIPFSEAEHQTEKLKVDAPAGDEIGPALTEE